MVVVVRRELCVGAAQCVLTAPGFFDQDEEDGRVVLHGTGEPDGEAVRLAVELCPSGALAFGAERPQTQS
ncbi:ferredoxin [Micromonospora chersina]|uniref:ferredoxin n=1 Tax=Micromonospora chersina TaxID=47854 RepID=UPI0033E828E9